MKKTGRGYVGKSLHKRTYAAGARTRAMRAMDLNDLRMYGTRLSRPATAAVKQIVRNQFETKMRVFHTGPFNVYHA
jgi:hypothetical protein